MPWLRTVAVLLSISAHAGLIAAVVARQDRATATPADIAVTVSFETPPMEARDTPAQAPPEVAAPAEAAATPDIPQAPAPAAAPEPAADAAAATAASAASLLPADVIHDAGAAAGAVPAETIAAGEAPPEAPRPLEPPMVVADERPPEAPSPPASAPPVGGPPIAEAVVAALAAAVVTVPMGEGAGEPDRTAVALAPDAAGAVDAAPAATQQSTAPPPPIPLPVALQPATPPLAATAPAGDAAPDVMPPAGQSQSPAAALPEAPAVVASLAAPPAQAPSPAVADEPVGPAAAGPPAPILPPVLAEAGDVPPPEGRVASLEARPGPDRIRDFVDRYDGGPCFFAAVTGTTADGPTIDSFSPSVDRVMAFDAAFLGALGVDPDVTGQRVWSAQCPVVDFLQRTRHAGGDGLRLDLDRRDMRVGDTLTGVVRGAAAAQVALFLVSETGMVEDVSNDLVVRMDGTGFAVHLVRSARSGPLPEILVVVARQDGRRNGLPLSQADAFFASLPTAVAPGGSAVRSAAVMFLLRE